MGGLTADNQVTDIVTPVDLFDRLHLLERKHT